MGTKRKLIVSFLSLAMVFGMISATGISAAKKPSMSKKITITEGSSKTIKVKNTKKKVKWKVVSGKNCITLKKKGKTAATVKGKKSGKAKVRATVGKKKLNCTVTVEAAGNKDKNDVAALKALIAQQRGRGATVSKDINDSKEYIWKNGRLVGIDWIFGSLEGNISFSSLPALTSLDCSNGYITELDVSKNTALRELGCYSNCLTKLDLSNNTALTELICFKNRLTELDLSKNTALTSLWCENNQLTKLDLSKNKYLIALGVECDKNVKVIWYS